MSTAPAVDRDDARSTAAADYDRWFDQQWGSYAFAVESAAVTRAAGAIDNEFVLDAGCGTGRFTTRLAKSRAIPVGVDLDSGMLGIAARRLPGRCSQATIEDLPFANATFDLAVAVTVLEFVADPAAAVAELVRVTRPGGRIVIGALNPHSPWGLANRRRLRSGAWCDARFLGRRYLSELGRPHGRIRLHATLYAPGAIAAPRVVGPVLEALGRVAPRWGAFQVLTITKAGDT
jgi:SAM-dependent methyltransferase